MSESNSTTPADGTQHTCDCDCECCKSGKCAHSEEKEQENTTISNVKLNEAVGASFLGILAIMLLIFLVRSNKRNRELLLDVIELQRRT